jgi:glycosyltransferase involved in cell wall biosynthesis
MTPHLTPTISANAEPDTLLVMERIAANRERVPSDILDLLEMDPTPREYFLNPHFIRTFYTAAIQNGNIENARLIGLVHKRGQQIERYWVWVGEDDAASDIGDQWLHIIYGFITNTWYSRAYTYTTIFTTPDNETIFWKRPFTMQTGDYIVHEER